MKREHFVHNGRLIEIKSAKGVQVKHFGIMKYRHLVTISYGDDATHFYYYDNGQETAPRNALNCFFTDALAGEMSFFEFACEFGYGDEQKAEAKRSHKGCQMARAKLHTIGFSDDDIRAIVEKEEEYWRDCCDIANKV